MLAIPGPIIDQIIADCLARRPEEACGLLIGRDGEIVRIETVLNVWPDPAERPTRYAIDPLTQMKAEQAARGAGLDLIGFYHSHPTSPPAPSQFDMDRAWPGYIYLIVGLADPAQPVLRAWALDEKGSFEEHPVGQFPSRNKEKRSNSCH